MLECIDNNPNSKIRRCGKATIIGLAKAFVGCKILLDRQKMMGGRVNSAASLGIILDGETLEAAEDFLSNNNIINLSNEETKAVMNLLAMCFVDSILYGKPLYTVGDKIGKNTVLLVKNTTKEIFGYKKEVKEDKKDEETSCSNFMNTVTCGCWGKFFKETSHVPGSTMSESPRTQRMERSAQEQSNSSFTHRNIRCSIY
jgi:hypothetical protein